MISNEYFYLVQQTIHDIDAHMPGVSYDPVRSANPYLFSWSHYYMCAGRSSSACARVLILKLHCDWSHVARYSSAAYIRQRRSFVDFHVAKYVRAMFGICFRFFKKYIILHTFGFSRDFRISEICFRFCFQFLESGRNVRWPGRPPFPSTHLSIFVIPS